MKKKSLLFLHFGLILFVVINLLNYIININ